MRRQDTGAAQGFTGRGVLAPGLLLLAVGLFVQLENEGGLTWETGDYAGRPSALPPPASEAHERVPGITTPSRQDGGGR